MPVEPKPINSVTYLLVRCESDADIEQIVGKIETIERDISMLTRLDVVSVKHTTLHDDNRRGAPVIYYP